MTNTATAGPLEKARSRHDSEERRILLAALKRNAGNVGATARELDIWETTLRREITKHGLDAQLGAYGRKPGRPRKEP
jgi:transcriptional regulator of acetoin/glycerol metabolism